MPNWRPACNTFICCLFCFRTDQQLDATAWIQNNNFINCVKSTEINWQTSCYGFSTYCFFERAVEPTIVYHILDRYWWILEIFKWIHEDEVKNDVIKVQMLYLSNIECDTIIHCNNLKHHCAQQNVFWFTGIIYNSFPRHDAKHNISHPSCRKLHFCVLPVISLLQKADHFFKNLLKSVWALQTTQHMSYEWTTLAISIKTLWQKTDH